MPKVKVPRLCSRSQPGIKVIIRDLRGHLLHTVTFLVLFISGSWQADVYMKAEMKYKSKNERELKLSKGKAVGLSGWPHIFSNQIS